MRRRTLSTAAVTAALVLTALTGCSQLADARSGCENPLGPGALSNGVEIDADGAVNISSSVDILNAQRSVAQSGDTRNLSTPGGLVVVDLQLFDAVTGELLQAQENAPIVVIPEAYIEEAETVLSSQSSSTIPTQYLLAVSMLCSAPGDTLVLAATAMQSQTSQLSLNPTVFVIDVLEVHPDHAQGRTQGLPNGFPAVAINAAGQPGIVLPPRQAPSDVRTSAHIVGSGDEVTSDQKVIGNVLTVDWNGVMLTNTWDGGLVMIGDEQSPNPEYTFREHLNGYSVGSQVVILDPNDGSPVVHVVDIVAAV